MLTVEVKLNGKVIAEAAMRNTSDLAALSDYRCSWFENAEPGLGMPAATGAFDITGHRRRQTAWALVARVVLGILGQQIDESSKRSLLCERAQSDQAVAGPPGAVAGQSSDPSLTGPAFPDNGFDHGTADDPACGTQT